MLELTRVIALAIAAAATAALAGSANPASAAAAAPDKATSPWWGHIKVLASDDFQGRLTGSPGYRKAAEYVAHTFEQDGLAPAGTNGYFQSVGFEVQSILADKSRVQLVSKEGAASDVSDSLVLSPSVIQRPEVKARLVFVGYGVHLPEAGYDDFAGLDVRGAVVVYVVGGPSTVTGAQRAHSAAEVLPHYLEGAGALGTLSITLPKNREVPWARQKAAGSQPGMVLSEKALRRYQGPMFSAAFDETKAEALFAGSGHTFGEIVDRAMAHQPMQHFALTPALSAHVETAVSKVSSDNVVAELPGSDPTLGAEAVALTAHLDHLGTGKPDHGDGIFHGAMDDASGIATLLEIADHMHRAKVKPKRSILFVAVCGEEKGLLGSRYFAAHPSRHEGRIVADLNSDMFLPLYPLSEVVGFGADESTLGDDLRAVGKEMQVGAVADPQPDHLVFVRADQYSFVRKGVPALMLQITPRPGTPEEGTYARWFTERYHAQADDLDQPVDLAAADAYNRLVYRLALRVADAPSAPKWKDSSFFAKFAAHPLT
ncbi:MAG TPA: M20/M25/M40 family metallo-hydrolase [Steroidobacteraceae bacterium]|jgi:Zn-dependent M28 family amino/carboxypeptidase|nr:M20/M25/M40 family metallo-hydrolase [Steroidobacteraceae bacterium]